MIQCLICELECKKERSLKYHITKTHRIFWEQYCKVFNISILKSSCKICGKEISVNRQYCSKKCKFLDKELNARRVRKIKNDQTKCSVCNICGKIINDQINASGNLTKHLKEFHDISDKEFQKYFKIEDRQQKNKFYCPLCDWTSNDLNNTSGWFTTHLKKAHNLSVEEFCNQFSEMKKLWKLYFEQKERTEFINKSKKNQIICLECGEKMKVVTNTHLKKHNLTKQQYKEKYKLVKLSSESTSEILSINTSRSNKELMGFYKESNLPMPWHRPEVFDKKVEENFKKFLENNNSDFECLFTINEYRNNQPLKTICKICRKESYNDNRGLRCYNCNPLLKGFSKEEVELREFLTNDLKLKIIVGNRKILNGLELDIFVPELNIAIEYDGIFWHSELAGKNKTYHLQKTLECERQNIRLIHVFEDEWISKKEITKARLKQLFNKTEKTIYARKCEVKEITSLEKNLFLSQTHIQGSSRSKINLGLFYKDELISVMTFGFLRAALGNKLKNRIDTEFELNRFASKCNVVGAAGKLLSYFIKN